MSGTGGRRPEVGVYGKVRGQADFLRAGAGDFCQAGLDRWFEAALEALRTSGGRLPEPPTAFLLAPDGARGAFVGAFAPSTDAVGRSFPLIVFAEIDQQDLVHRLAAVPASFRSFVDEAALLVALAPESPGEVLARVDALAAFAAHPDDGRSFMPSLGDVPAQPLLAALGDSPRALGYAMRTFVAACEQAMKTGPRATSGVITVDAPAPPAARQLWLELAARKLRWRDALPSMLWTETPTGRLLLTLGPPAPASLSYLANPRNRSSRLWPLKTDVVAALDQAMGLLTPEQRRCVEDPRCSLGDLLTAFA